MISRVTLEKGLPLLIDSLHRLSLWFATVKQTLCFQQRFQRRSCYLVILTTNSKENAFAVTLFTEENADEENRSTRISPFLV